MRTKITYICKHTVLIIRCNLFKQNLVEAHICIRNYLRGVGIHISLAHPSHTLYIILITTSLSALFMMTSSNGNIFRVTCHLCGNFPHKGQWREALMFSLIFAWINDWVNNREAGDLRRQHGHYDVIVMYHHVRPPPIADKIWATSSTNHFHHLNEKSQQYLNELQTENVGTRNLEPIFRYERVVHMWVWRHKFNVDNSSTSQM